MKANDRLKFIPHAYFKTESITHRGDRDSHGLFVKPTITLSYCSKRDAEFATGIIPMKQSFALVRLKKQVGKTNKRKD